MKKDEIVHANCSEWDEHVSPSWNTDPRPPLEREIDRVREYDEQEE